MHVAGVFIALGAIKIIVSSGDQSAKNYLLFTVFLYFSSAA